MAGLVVRCLPSSAGWGQKLFVQQIKTTFIGRVCLRAVNSPEYNRIIEPKLSGQDSVQQGGKKHLQRKFFFSGQLFFCLFSSASRSLARCWMSKREAAGTVMAKNMLEREKNRNQWTLKWAGIWMFHYYVTYLLSKKKVVQSLAL